MSIQLDPNQKTIHPAFVLVGRREVADNADDASQIAEDIVARALANRVQTVVKISPIDCVECGDPIEPERRAVIAGTEHCAECAAYFAERDRLFNGGR